MAEETRGDELELLVGGERFTRWESMSVERNLEAVAGSFRVATSSRIPWPIRPGDEVQVALTDTDPILTGHVDEVAATGDASRTSFTVAGRDVTADLIDCSETSAAGEWLDIGLKDLVREIANPFGIEVFEETDLSSFANFERFTRQSGETAWSAISRAARQRGVLAFTRGDGVLSLSRPASRVASVELRTGRRGNVLRWELKVSHQARFRTYTVRGQNQGDDFAFGADVSEIEGTAEDPAIGRFRPLVVLAEGAVTFEDAADRAAYEATFRAARASTLSVRVKGWRQTAPFGRPWAVNEVVSVIIPEASVDQELLVNRVRFSRDGDGGTVTELGLTRRDAYVPQPVVDDREEAFEDFLGGDDDDDDLDLDAPL